jgi:O-antigen/teichoic acid export membrane protein
VGLASGFIFTILVSKWYGASALGIVSLTTSFLLIAVFLSKAGLDSAYLFLAIRKIKNEGKESAQSVFNSVFYWLLILGVSFTLLFIIGNNFIATTIFQKPYLAKFLLHTSYLVLPFGLLYFISEGFRAYGKNNYFSFFSVTSFSFVSLVILYLIPEKGADPFDVILSRNAGITLSCIVAAVVFKNFSKIKVSFLKPRIPPKEIFGVAFPMMVSNSMGIVMQNSGILILGIFQSDSQVGIFKVVTSFSLLASLFLVTIANISAPMYAEAYASNDINKMKVVSDKSTRLIFWGSFPVLLIILFFPSHLLSLVGNEYKDGAIALIILTVGQFFNAISGSVGFILNMTNKHVLRRNTSIISALFNIVLGFLLIPFYGIIGAAIAAAASNILWNLLGIFYINKLYGFRTIYIPGIFR